MAEGRQVHSDPVAEDTWDDIPDSSGGIEYIKEEVPDEFQEGLEPLSIDTGPPVPPPQFVIPLLPTPPVHRPPPRPWAGTRPAVPPLLPELANLQGPRRPWLPETFSVSGRPQAPTKWQEAFHLYTLYVDTNNKARYSLGSGCITFYAAQRIYLSGLQDIRRQTEAGRLASCYLQEMLNYGKLHKYIGPDINS